MRVVAFRMAGSVHGAFSAWRVAGLLGRLSGLETLVFTNTLGFCNVGERCNIAGSIAFKKLILEGKYDDALEVAKKQVSASSMFTQHGVACPLHAHAQEVAK
jgi:hypothetical protein